MLLNSVVSFRVPFVELTRWLIKLKYEIWRRGRKHRRVFSPMVSFQDTLAELDGGTPRMIFGQTALFLHEILVECHL